MLVREGNNFISDGIYDDVVRTKCCRKSYIRGVFLACGSVNNPDKTYHLEFVCNSERFALDLKKLINGFVDMTAKTMERRGKYIVYVKSLSNIRDMLAIIGAHSHVLSFDNTVIKKQMRNRTVRITNCDNANMDRALDAAQRQIAAIRAIESRGGCAKPQGSAWKTPTPASHSSESCVRLRSRKPESTADFRRYFLSRKSTGA